MLFAGGHAHKAIFKSLFLFPQIRHGVGKTFMIELKLW